MDELAEHYGAKVTRAKVRLYDGTVLTRQLRAQYREHKIELLASHDSMLVDVEANYGTFTLFFINPRPTLSWKGVEPAYRIDAGGATHRVFVRSGKLSVAQSELIESGIVKRLLESAAPNDREEINISQRLVRFYLDSPSAERVKNTIQAVIGCMPHGLVSDSRSTSLSLPASLRPLVPLLAKWAISDDEERSKKLGRSARSTLQRLVSTVLPLLPAINQYLDGLGENPPEEACGWGDLSQAAVEAQAILAEARAE